MNCESCKEVKSEPVPYIVHESAMARMERANKKLWIVIVILIALLAVSNGLWIWYESQFEVYETWQEVYQETDGTGSNRFIGGDYYGEPEGYDKEERP